MKVKNSLKFFLVLVLVVRAGIAFGGEIRRSHLFLRPMAMGDAFTAVADSMETIAHNPAGLLQKDVEWSLAFPIFWLSFDDVVNQSMKGSLDIDFDDMSSLDELKGKRIYFELQLGFPFFYSPDSGVFWGISTDNWFEFVFPMQSVLPMVHLEAINQNMVEYAMAFEPFDLGVSVGVTLKAVQRTGVVADVGLLVIPNLIDDEDFEKTRKNLEEAYFAEQPPLKVVVDVGALYRIDHPWKPRIGVSCLDVVSLDMDGENEVNYGGVEYGSAGSVKQINSIGGAMTQSIRELDLTYSADFHDFTFSYFSNNSIKRRIALGFEAGLGRYEDNSHLMALQVGLRELEYPSFGVSTKIGIFEMSMAQWTENFGTEKNEALDERYSLLLSFVF